MMYSVISWLSASIIETSVLYPLDVAVTRLQTSPIYVPARSASSIIARLYTNRILYNGFIPHMASNIPLLSFRYFAAQKVNIKQHALPAAALAGAAFGAIEGAIITPFEAIKIPMQSMLIFQFRREGFKSVTQNGTDYRGLFRGLLPTVARQSIYGTVTFSSVKLLGDIQNRDVASGASHLGVCCFISAMTIIIGNPLDVIKARSQSLLQFPSITKRHLFAGLPIKLWRVTLGTGILMMVYDEIARFPKTLTSH